MKKTVVVFSGAGLSAESGIPTFRASDGLWENHRIEDVASPEGWMRNPKLVLNFYNERYEKIMQAQPNPAHIAIARLQDKFHVVNITQNIDNLLERAGCQNVWHLHGSVQTMKCEHHIDIGIGISSYYYCDYKTDWKDKITEKDKCPKCGGQMRPDIVWFGEAVDMRHEYLYELVATAFIFIGVGTSAQVYPAAGLLPTFQNTPHKYFIDPNPAYSMLRGYHVIADTASRALPKLADELMHRFG
ncbi:MAG: silent information regulator protein Sir2 [Bacteroidia bacterium]|nr:silent information regulator protein Sir2 [Bacteroidia bacterium]MDW8301499.1 Sir2 family NAD-dependent protein deacetylase [Bacteroidia bacterium]